MPIINRQVPTFKAEVFQKGAFRTITDADLRGKWSVVVFYPADCTCVCPTELEDLAKHYAEFQALNAEIYAVSCDTHFTHKAWHDTSPAIGKIEYPMVARGFDVMIEEEGLAYRGSFIINPECVIKVAEIHDNSVGRDAKALLRNLKAAKYVAEHDGEVCPAAWEEGEKTLKPSLDLVGKI